MSTKEVNREIPFDGLHWFFDHCETITDRNIGRVKALGGGIAVQNRMAFQGEYLSSGTVRSRRNARRRFDACWKWVFRSAPAPTQPAFRAKTRTFPSIGLSLARPLADSSLSEREPT